MSASLPSPDAARFLPVTHTCAAERGRVGIGKSESRWQTGGAPGASLLVSSLNWGGVRLRSAPPAFLGGDEPISMLPGCRPEASKSLRPAFAARDSIRARTSVIASMFFNPLTAYNNGGEA